MKIEVKVIDQVNSQGNMKTPDKKFLSVMSKLIKDFIYDDGFQEELHRYHKDAVGAVEVTVV